MVTITTPQELKRILKEVFSEYFNNGTERRKVYPTNDVIGINEVSEITSLKTSTIRKKVHLGEIPVLEKGKPLLFSREEIIDWQDNGRRINRF